jgi:hypothetical protein
MKPARAAGDAEPSDAPAHVESDSDFGVERRADTGQRTLLLERPPGASHEALPELEFLLGGIMGEKVSIATVG